MMTLSPTEVTLTCCCWEHTQQHFQHCPGAPNAAPALSAAPRQPQCTAAESWETALGYLHENLQEKSVPKKQLLTSIYMQSIL